MDLSPESQLIHERARLRIMGLLYRENDLPFGALRETLALTGGNLASHVARLEAAGLVEARAALTPTGFERRVQITALGIARFDTYVQELQGLLPTARDERSVDGSHAPVEAPDSTRSVRPPLNRTKTAHAIIATGGLFVLGEGVQQWFGDASGSAYLGILVSGGLLALIPMLLALPRWSKRQP